MGVVYTNMRPLYTVITTSKQYKNVRDHELFKKDSLLRLLNE